MDLILIRDYLGLFAPLILFILTVFLLSNKSIYLQFFISGFILNTILNILLKIAIKEPRPNHEKKLIEIGVVNGAIIGFDKFGMPSGHAQNSSYCLTFITMVLNNPFITGLYFVISIISLLQRYLYKNHTILQLVVGFLLGGGFGIFIYYLANSCIQGNIKRKKDDDAPI